MESPSIAKIFRRLLSHETCSKLRYPSSLRYRELSAIRSYHDVTGGRGIKDDNESANEQTHWQQRTALFPQNRSAEYERYPMVTAKMLRTRRERPKRVKMLMRDFIEDSLYNPQYGYFSKQVVIFNPGEPFDFNSMADENAFHRLLGQKYTKLEDDLDKQQPNEARQLWHTPTELFQPYYGEAIAQYLVRNYTLTYYPHRDLIIYEMGAGNGTLMLNILDYIRDFHPRIYDRTKYKIIEISSNLAELQASQLGKSAAAGGHLEHIEIVNQSIFDWNIFVSDPCYFLALEVFDNFAHDCIRYDPFSEEPLQGQVLVDNDGEFYEFYTKEIDEDTSRFLRLRNAVCSRSFAHPLQGSPMLRRLRHRLPLAPNLTLAEYIPTRLMQFFDVLNDHFPLHHLLASDFHTLPDTIAGYNAPVVQTRYQRRVVPVTTPLVQQGYFDILFPTNFTMMEDIYGAITGRQTKMYSQEDFLRQWAYVEDTRTQNGENPLLSWYKNASVMTTR